MIPLNPHYRQSKAAERLWKQMQRYNAAKTNPNTTKPQLAALTNRLRKANLVYAKRNLPILRAEATLALGKEKKELLEQIKFWESVLAGKIKF